MSAPYYADGNATIYHGDARHLPLADASVDAIVCDPPYEINFMSRSWDAAGVAFDPTTWREALRVLKPGGYLLAFGGSRTWHRLVCAVEDAGFEIRDSMAWLYGSGFPKALDVSRAIDKAAGAEREVVGVSPFASRKPNGTWTGDIYGAEPGHASGPTVTAPATDDARRWQGWGTALKPGHEPLVVARKPLVGTVAANVLAHGTGALNIDGCRVDADGERFGGGAKASSGYSGIGGYGGGFAVSGLGRWPTNVVLSHAPLADAGGDVGDACGDGCVPGCPVAELDAQSGIQRDGVAVNRNRAPGRYQAPSCYGEYATKAGADVGYGGQGGASRFFPTFRYQAKAPSRERPKVDGVAHPTVKPLALMRWLCRLVTPPSGVVLDPFAGSGTTIEAALLEGFRVVGVEQHAPYLPLIQARIARVGVPADQGDIFENMPTVA